MSDSPQIYLVTPPSFETESFAPILSRILDAREVACLRLALASQDSDEISRTADALREIAHSRDIPLVLDSHSQLVEKLGLDGVHLQDTRSIRDLRKTFGADPIIGAFCGASRHDGMAAGEAGADYIAFGPLSETGLGGGGTAEADLFSWWSEMIELPVVAEGGLTAGLIAEFAPVTDFFAIGPEIWSAEDPLATLEALLAAL